MTFAKVVSLCRCVAAFGVVVAACGVLWPPFPPLFLSFAPLERHPPLPFSNASPVCRQAGTRAGGLAGKRADRFACKGKGLSQRLYPFAIAWQHLALSWQLVAFFGHLFHRFSYRLAHWNGICPLHFHHTFVWMPACRQAQGQADWQAGEQAGGQEYLPPGKKECQPVRGSIG